MRNRRWLAVAAVVTLAPAPARASDRDDYTKYDWPVQAILRPLTLAPAMFEVGSDTFRINLSKNEALEPLSLAPSVRYGVTRRFTVGVFHHLGICVSTNGCGSTYNDAGLEASYAVVSTGPFQVTARAGLQAPRFSPFFFGARPGLSLRVRTWRIALVADPSLYVGLVGREKNPDPDEDTDDPYRRGRKEILDCPVDLQVQVTSRAMVFLSSGLESPIYDLANRFLLPVGVGGLFALNHKVDLGLEWRFDNLLGAGGTVPSGWDQRTLFVRAALRL